jgi:hypothetical protein
MKSVPKKYAKPLSLHPMHFEQAVDTQLAHKPIKTAPKKKKR